jgi:hypothetical protein
MEIIKPKKEVIKVIKVRKIIKKIKVIKVIKKIKVDKMVKDSKEVEVNKITMTHKIQTMKTKQVNDLIDLF